MNFEDSTPSYWEGGCHLILWADCGAQVSAIRSDPTQKWTIFGCNSEESHVPAEWGLEEIKFHLRATLAEALRTSLAKLEA